MKKALKTMLSAVCAVTMLAGAVMPVSAESSYDHEKAMNEFRNYIDDKIAEIEKNCDILNSLAENPDNFYEDNNSPYYQLTDEAIAENGLSENFKYTPFFKSADNNKFYYGFASSANIEFINERIKYFNPHNIDGTDYITIDGHDYIYHILEGENDSSTLYVNFLGDSVFSHFAEDWYKPVKTPFITDADWAEAENNSEYAEYLESIIKSIEEYNNNRIPEYVYEEEYENIFYLADKIYEASLTDMYSFIDKTFSDFNFDNMGFETIDEYRRYCAESVAVDVLAEMSQEKEMPESIKPLLDENGTFTRDIDNDGDWTPKDIEIFKKYYNNELVAYDLDFDDKLTVKDLSYVKKYLVNEADISPMQRVVALNDDNTIDVRTVTTIAQKIVGLE